MDEAVGVVNGESGLSGDHPNGRCSNTERAGASGAGEDTPRGTEWKLRWFYERLRSGSNIALLPIDRSRNESATRHYDTGRPMKHRRKRSISQARAISRGRK